MKDFRNPACWETCGANPEIVRIKETTEEIEDKAKKAGCISENGEINCSGLQRTIRVTDSIVTTGVRCAATIKTPDIMHFDEIQTADGFTSEIMQTMGGVCEFE